MRTTGRSNFHKLHRFTDEELQQMAADQVEVTVKEFLQDTLAWRKRQLEKEIMFGRRAAIRDSPPPWGQTGLTTEYQRRVLVIEHGLNEQWVLAPVFKVLPSVIEPSMSNYRGYNWARVALRSPLRGMTLPPHVAELEQLPSDVAFTTDLTSYCELLGRARIRLMSVSSSLPMLPSPDYRVLRHPVLGDWADVWLAPIQERVHAYRPRRRNYLKAFLKSVAEQAPTK